MHSLQCPSLPVSALEGSQCLVWEVVLHAKENTLKESAQRKRRQKEETTHSRNDSLKLSEFKLKICKDT